MTCGIYEIFDGTGKIYIGSSKNIENRIKGHKRALKNCEHQNRLLQSAFLKRGADFDHRVLLVCREEDLFFYEQICLDGFKPNYNLSRYADRVDFTEEVRSAIGEANSKRVISEKTRAKLSRLRKGNKHALGHRQTDSQKASRTGENNYRSKKVVCLNDGRIFGARNEASRFYGVVGRAISAVCNGEAKEINGLRFKYIETEK